MANTIEKHVGRRPCFLRKKDAPPMPWDECQDGESAQESQRWGMELYVEEKGESALDQQRQTQDNQRLKLPGHLAGSRLTDHVHS